MMTTSRCPIDSSRRNRGLHRIDSNKSTGRLEDCLPACKICMHRWSIVLQGRCQINNNNNNKRDKGTPAAKTCMSKPHLPLHNSSNINRRRKHFHLLRQRHNNNNKRIHPNRTMTSISKRTMTMTIYPCAHKAMRSQHLRTGQSRQQRKVTKRHATQQSTTTIRRHDTKTKTTTAIHNGIQFLWRLWWCVNPEDLRAWYPSGVQRHRDIFGTGWRYRTSDQWWRRRRGDSKYWSCIHLLLIIIIIINRWSFDQHSHCIRRQAQVHGVTSCSWPYRK